MTERAVCVAFPTIMDGLVLRWYASPDAYVNGAEMVSASRNGVRVLTFLHEVPADVLTQAQEAHTLIARGRGDEAQAMATHRAMLLSRELVPIDREAANA